MWLMMGLLRITRNWNEMSCFECVVVSCYMYVLWFERDEGFFFSFFFNVGDSSSVHCSSDNWIDEHEK